MKSKAAVRGEKSAFVRGLLTAVLILYFSQAWTWYEKSNGYLEQSFDLTNEIDFNKGFLILADSAAKTVNKTTQTVPAGLYKPYIEHLSTSAFERSGQFLANEPLSDIAHIRSYYALVKLLQSALQTELVVEDIVDRTEQQTQKKVDRVLEMERELTQKEEKVGARPALRKEVTSHLAGILTAQNSAMQSAAKSRQDFVVMLAKQIELCASESLLARNGLDKIYQGWAFRKRLLLIAIICLPFLLVLWLPGTSRTQDLIWIKFKRSLRRFRHHAPEASPSKIDAERRE